MGLGGPSTQEVVQKTELDPIQKSFLYGTPLPEDYKAVMDANNRRVLGLPEPVAEAEAPVAAMAPQVNMMGVGGGDYGGGAGGVGGGVGGGSPAGAGGMGPGYGGLYANGGIVTLANGGMVPSRLPDLGNRDMAYRAAMGAIGPQYAVGGLIEGPGTGTSDDIPATIYQSGMPVGEAALSDGEVVLSRRDLANMDPMGNADRAADMVGNAPNGSRGEAAARMYSMMNQFRYGGRVG